MTGRLRRMNAVRDSEQAQELIDGHSGVANQGPEGSYGKLSVLGNGKVHPHLRLDHHQMAPHLTQDTPSSFLKGFGRFLAGNVVPLPKV
jgi:hypothetical protein